MKKMLESKKNLIMVMLVSFALGNSQIIAQELSKNQIVGEWDFAEITMITPKVGYVPSLAKKEISLMSMCMANYNFNENGSVSFSDKYLNKNDMVSASWELDGSTINITYNFKEGAEGHTNSSETLPWTIESVSEETLVINLMGMFKVKLEK